MGWSGEKSAFLGEDCVNPAEVQVNGWSLQFASAELRGDREIVLAAVTHPDSGIPLWFFVSS